MALIINTNVAALNAQRNLSKAQFGLNRAIQRLSTGLRINGAVDDAAGLAISDRLTAQIRGLNQAVRNANDGVSTLQTADGSLQEVANLLQRARELSIQSANDSNSSDDRTSLNAEVNNIISELDRLATTVSFNNKNLLDGTFSSQQFQIGSNANQTVTFSIKSSQTKDLGAAIRVGAAFSDTALATLGTITVNSTTVVISAQTTLQGVIDKINTKTGTTNATAVKNSKTVVTATAFRALTSAGSSNVTLTINGVDITLTTGNASSVAKFISRVNEFSTQTGVIAAGVASALTFTRSNGGDIAFTEVQAVAASSNGVANNVADSTKTNFVAGVTLKVDLDKTLTIASGTTALSVIGLNGTTLQNKKVSALDIKTVTGSNDAINTIDFALTQLNKIRGDIGAVQNRFNSAISSLEVSSENLSAARSRVRDADVAQETANLTRGQILIQAGVAVLAQANQLPSIALGLLGP